MNPGADRLPSGVRRVPWDGESLAVEAGLWGDPAAFSAAVLRGAGTRDGMPVDPAARCDPDMWLRGLWSGLEGRGMRGYRGVAGLRMPWPLAEAADEIGATHVRSPALLDGRSGPGLDWGRSTLRSALGRLALRALEGPGRLAVADIASDAPGAGLGTRVLGRLARRAGARGEELVAVAVTAPAYFERLGWTPLGGGAWRAPFPVDGVARG